MIEQIQQQVSLIVDSLHHEVVSRLLSKLSGDSVFNTAECPKLVALKSYVSNKRMLRSLDIKCKTDWLNDSEHLLYQKLTRETKARRRSYYERECKCGQCNKDQRV